MEGRLRGERVQRGGQAEDQPDRAAGDLRGDRGALGAGLVHAAHQALPAVRIGGAVGQQEPERPAGGAVLAGHPGEFVGFVLKIGQHAESSGTDLAERRANPEQFLVFRVAAGDLLAGHRTVVLGA